MTLAGGSFSELDERARTVAEGILSMPKEDPVLVVSHLDADGLSSGSIITCALLGAGFAPHQRVVKQLDPDTIKEVASTAYRNVIFTDMGSGQKSMMGVLEGKSIFIMDHHQPEQGYPNPNEMNAHLFGFDGSNDISASGTSFLVARKMSESNSSLAQLALVGALGDLQDKGERGTLIGINAKIAEDAEKAGALIIKKGLKLYGFESRPLVKCLEYTMDPYLPGLSGDEGACFKLIKNLGIDPRRPDGTWKPISDLSKDDLKVVISGMIKYLISQGLSSRDAESIVGVIYAFPNESPDSPLRDAREFASSINACGRLGKYGLGIAICMGDRDRALAEMKSTLADYRKTISRHLGWLEKTKEAVKILPGLQVIYGGSTVDDKIIGTLVSIAFSIKPFTNDKPIIGFSNASGVVKVSGRGTVDLVRRGLNLGVLMKETSEKLGGAGGGHNIAAGAQIPAGKEEEFISLAESALAKMVTGVKL